ncbi:MAG: hypothetical protein AB1746_01720 [Candidatus Zixiibacteriota bacterium]
MRDLIRQFVFVLPVLALLAVIAGCSTDEIAGSSSVTSDYSNFSTIRTAPDSRQADTPSSLELSKQYPFVYSGTVKAIDQEKGVIVFENKDFIALLGERPLLIDRTTNRKMDFSYDRLAVKSTITVYGYPQKDDTVIIEVIELWGDDRVVNTASAS